MRNSSESNDADTKLPFFSVQQAASEYFIVNLRNDATVIARLVDK